MDFLSKILQRKPPKSGGGSPAAVSTPVKPDHEAHVQFAREFVVELVETVPKKSEKAALAKISDKEDVVSLKSVSPSEGSFQSVSTVTDNASLPDLLQPESVYKKQTDTDTDTTEYESAAETEASSPIENLIAEDLLASFQEALDKKYPPSSSEEPIAKESTDTSVSQDSDPSPLSEAYEDVSETITKPVEEVKSLDISGLCYCVSNLCLDSPKSEKDTVNTNSSITAVNDSYLCDITYVADSNSTKVNDSALNLTVDGELISEVTHTAVSKSPELTPVKSIQDTSTCEITPTQLTGKPTEADLSEPEVEKSIELEPLEIKLEKTLESVLFSEKVEETEDKQPLEVESDKKSETKLEVKVQEKPEETSKLKSEILIKENTPEPKSVEVPPETNLELISSKKNAQETSELYDSEVKPEQTSGTKPVERKEEVSFRKLEETSDSTSESKPSVVTSEKISEEKLFAVETVKSTVPQPDGIKEHCTLESKPIKDLPENPSETQIVEIKPQESIETKPVEIPIEKSLESKLVEITGQPSEFKSVQEKTELEVRSINTPETRLNSEARSSEQKVENTSETKGVEITLEKTLEIKPFELTVTQTLTEKLGLTSSKKGTEVEVQEKYVKLSETPLDAKTEKVLEIECVERAIQKETKVSSTNIPELNIHEVIPVKSLELETAEISSVITTEKNTSVTEVTEAKTNVNKTDSEQKFEVDICSSESIPIVETPSVASVTDSVDDKLLESKDFSTSFEILSIEKEIVSELCESKAQREREESVVRVEVGAGDCNTQREEQEHKKEPTVLTELFEICDRQQKDLELGDEKFVDGREFFTPPSNSCNLSQTIVVSNSQPELSDSVSDRTDFGDFDESIAEEAEKIYQDILNASSHMSSVDCTSSTMADVHEENSANPFVTSSSLRRSPPPSGKPSPRSSSQGPSPSDSPRARSKLSMVNQVRDNCSPRDGSGEASPRSRSGKNSPDRRISSNRLTSMEGSPKNSINAEINQSEAGPDIAEDAHLQSGDVFKDAAAFDFLNSIGNSNTATDLRKESLYVKFDPLVGARTVDHSVPLPPAVEAKSNNITMLAVTSSPRELHTNNTTPPRNDAISVVDKLISLSPSPRRQQQIVTPVKQEEPDNSAMVEELYLLREILAKQDEKHREDILKLQHQIECLQAKLKEYEEREAGLNKKVAEKAQGQKQMSIIMEEYEKTISRLVAEKEEERQAHELDKSSLAKERDTAMGHLGNIEIAFSDLHKKYERSKTVIEGFKKNEEVLRASLAEYEATIRKQEQKYDVLKSHAMAQLENANQELDSVRRSQQAEAAKLKAMLKKAEVKTSSLEEMLEQKVKENQELASICDELINKVGSSQ